MTYQETVNYLFNSTPVFEHVGATAYKEGLENAHALDEHFGHPHTKFKTIHVAGTNGKGSCSHTLAAILQSQGYKVGLYTSPHIVDFRERMRVNGKCISEQYIIDFVEKERAFFEPLHPSFFELTTAMAFKYFAEEEVDIAVIEVGLGGRLDCTNIITPLVSIITNISMDHTQFLGDTLAKIAGEKAGIIKEGIPVVIGETVDETRPVFINKAKEKNAPITFAERNQQIMSYDIQEDGRMSYKTKDYGTIDGELGGIYQVKNTNTVLNALTILCKNGLEISNDAIRSGFANVNELTGLVGRWQRIHESPLAICDTGHNAGGWQYLSKQIKIQKCDKKHIVFGMVDDKDIHTVMTMMPKDAIFYFTQPSCKRALAKEKVAHIAAENGLKGSVYENVKTAYEAALKNAAPNDFIFVGGSSYIVSDLLSI